MVERADENRLPMSSPDKPLEEGIADAITDELTSGSAVSDRRALTKRAALAGLQEMARLTAGIVGGMAADHERRGDAAGARALRKAVRQIGKVLADAP